MAFDNKLKMTNAALSAKFHGRQKILNAWSKAYNRLPEKNKNRNKLAHGSLINFIYKRPDNPVKVEIFLCPYYMSAQRRRMPEDIVSVSSPIPDDALSSTDIDGMTQGFKNVEASLLKVCGAIRDELTLAKPDSPVA